MTEDKKEGIDCSGSEASVDSGKRFSKRKTNIIKTICMLLCLSLIFGTLTYVSDIFSFDMQVGFHYTRIRGFRNEPENTIDVVSLGSSTGRAWLPITAWENYGITSYNLSTSRQPFRSTKILINNLILDNQKPKVIIVDLGSSIKDPSTIDPLFIREISENLNFFDRVTFLNDILYYARENENVTSNDLWSYYFPFLWEHNNYYNLWDKDGYVIENKYSNLKGTLVYAEFYVPGRAKKVEKIPEDIEPLELDEKAMETLEDFIDFCDSRDDFNVVFTVMPKTGERKSENKAGSFEDENRRIKYVVNYVRGRGYEVLNFLEDEYLDKLELDYEKDFTDQRHMTIFGGIKYTDYVCRYILDNYTLPDRTSDEAIVENWTEACKNFAQVFFGRVHS